MSGKEPLIARKKWVDKMFYSPKTAGRAFDAYWENQRGDIIEIFDGNFIKWTNGKLTKITIQNDFTEIVFENNGEKCRGALSDSRSELIWEDGDVWTKFSASDPPERTPILLVGFVTLFTFGITQFLIATWLEEHFEDDSGAYAIWWGFYNGVPVLISFFLNAMWGDWSDIIGRKPVFIIACCILLFYPGAMFISPTIPGVVVSSLASGCGNIWLIMMMTMFTDFSKYQEEIAKNFGKALVLLALGSICGVFLISILIQRADPSWRALFLIAVIGFIIVIMYLYIFAPETNHGVWKKYYGVSYHKNTIVAEKDEDEFAENAVEKADEEESPPIERREIERVVERNPWTLIRSIKDEPTRLRGYVLVRAINVYLFYSFQATLPALMEEVHGWDTHQLLPVLLESLVLMIISNAFVRTFQRRMKTENIVLLGICLNAIETGIRCFVGVDVAFLYIARLFLFGPASILPACITSLISEISEPKKLGRILGAVDAISMFFNAIAWTVPVLLFALFVGGNGVPYIPVMPWIIEFCINILLAIIFWSLINYTDKPELQIASRDQPIRMTEPTADIETKEGLKDRKAGNKESESGLSGGEASNNPSDQNKQVHE